MSIPRYSDEIATLKKALKETKQSNASAKKLQWSAEEKAKEVTEEKEKEKKEKERLLGELRVRVMSITIVLSLLGELRVRMSIVVSLLGEVRVRIMSITIVVSLVGEVSVRIRISLWERGKEKGSCHCGFTKVVYQKSSTTKIIFM